MKKKGLFYPSLSAPGFLCPAWECHLLYSRRAAGLACEQRACQGWFVRGHPHLQRNETGWSLESPLWRLQVAIQGLSSICFLLHLPPFLPGSTDRKQRLWFEIEVVLQRERKAQGALCPSERGDGVADIRGALSLCRMVARCDLRCPSCKLLLDV